MWPFRKARAKPAIDLDRYRFQWKDGAALFDYQCKFGFTDVQEGKGIVALVLDARKEFGTSVAVKVGPDGRQLATLRVASPDGGFIVPASTPSNRGDPLQPGDVVIWVPGKYVPEVAKVVGDTRSGWVGLIRAKVDLTQPAAQGPLQLICEYD